MSSQQQIRELRNKILGEQPKIFIVEAGYGKRINKAETVTGRYEDRPVSTNDLLRMLSKKDSIFIEMFVSRNLDIREKVDTKNSRHLFEIDLTKDIEQQDEKVVVEIIKTLT